MLRKLLFLLIIVPLAIILVVLCVANRHVISLNLDPFGNVDSPILGPVELPFFVYLFAALVLGMVLGGMITWLRQGRFRRQMRQNRIEANKWQNEAETQKKRAEELASDKVNAAQADQSDAHSTPTFEALKLPMAG